MRKQPLEKKTALDIISSIGYGGERLPLPIFPPPGCSRNYLNLIRECWAEAYERPTFRSIMGVLSDMLATFVSNSPPNSNPSENSSTNLHEIVNSSDEFAEV